MREKGLWKKLLSVLFVLGMAVVLLPGMSLTAYADDDPPYAQYKNTTTVITFDGKSWYLIDYDPSTVTLLAKECVGVSKYNESGTFIDYSSNPTVKTAVDNWYSNSITADAKTAVSGGGMFLLTTAQANAITNADVRKCSRTWWLCSKGNSDVSAAFVDGVSGDVSGNGTRVDVIQLGARPALKLDLTKVTFDSNTNTFSMKSTPTPTPTPKPSSDNTPAPEPKHEQDQTLVTGFITNGNDANGNPTYAYFSQENVWSVTKISSNANSITYDITPQWETYGTVNIGIPAPGFPDGPVLVDHYKNGKLIATYNGWVTAEWCTFDNPDGYSTFVIRKPGTNAQTAKRAYVPNTGVE